MSDIFSASQFQLEEEQLLSDLRLDIEETIKELTDIDERYDEIVTEQQVEKEAHVAAINHVTQFAFIYFKTEFIKAIVETDEYNHPLFIKQTEEALAQHEQARDLIFVTAERPGRITVDIDMLKLGTAEDWLRAAEKAYPKSKGIQDIGVRSHIWMEKIYRVDREGQKVPPKDGEDITDKYVGKWTQTITNRLGHINSDQAPWWELINYGNNVFAGTGGGKPYPSFGPTYFVNLVVRAIEIAFYRFYDEVRAAFNFEETIELTKAAEAAIQEYDPNIIPRLKRQRETAQVYKILDQINADQKAWELYLTTGGRIGLRYSLSRNIRRGGAG
jgi:hypothetical protein